MPTILAHTYLALGASIGSGRPWVSRRLAVACVAASVLPDFDALGYWAGVPYGSIWGHRGATHSILASALVAVCAAWFAPRLQARRWVAATAVGLSMVSHGLLDAATSGGKGVAFFWPLTTERFFFPWHPIRVSPMGTGIFSARGVAVLASEIVWVGLPAIALGVGLWVVRRRRKL